MSDTRRPLTTTTEGNVMPDPDRTTPHDDRADDQVGLYEQIYGRPPVDPQQNGDSR